MVSVQKCRSAKLGVLVEGVVVVAATRGRTKMQPRVVVTTIQQHHWVTTGTRSHGVRSVSIQSHREFNISSNVSLVNSLFHTRLKLFIM